MGASPPRPSLSLEPEPEPVEEHAQLVERAKALVARERPTVTLGELHLEAMRLLVASLEKRKFAVTERSRTSAKSPRRRRETERDGHEPGSAPRQRGETEPRAHESPSALCETEPRQYESLSAPRQHGETEPRQYESLSAPRQHGETEPRHRGRYIPASERREVYHRDEGRCTYIDARGERCCETRYLELHHLQPFARHGAHSSANLTLRCAAHNALAAEHDFGPRLMAERRESTRHEALARQLLASFDAEG